MSNPNPPPPVSKPEASENESIETPLSGVRETEVRALARRRGKLYTAMVCLLVAGAVSVIAVATYVTVVLYPSLPPVSSLGDYRPVEPLRIYSSDNHLLAEYGIERRIPLELSQIPIQVRQALLATEDSGFYEHDGVDFGGLLRAVFIDVVRGGKAQGGSTITMQLARNFFLSRNKTFARKLYEILLAIKIERHLSKDQILQLYMNQIYLGERSYGFGAAALTYFGQDVDKLTIGQAAMLAGLPKAPSTFNPINDPTRAQARQRFVLSRMRDVGFLSDAQYETALSEPAYVRPPQRQDLVPADSVSELVRKLMFERYGEASYESGFKVTTTVSLDDQVAAFDAVRRGIDAYQFRHPYVGPEGHVSPPVVVNGALTKVALDAMRERPTAYGMPCAVVLSASATKIEAVLLGGDRITMTGKDLAFLESQGTGTKAAKVNRPRSGDLIRVFQTPDGQWSITQLPTIQAALVALSPKDGAIRALVGGNGVSTNQLNHVTQAWRQPGSSFKGFLYSAALSRGFGPTTIVDDLPVKIPATYSGGKTWRPRESGVPLGPISLREGVARSKNFVAIRVLSAISPEYAKDYVVRTFGLRADLIPANLPMALGAGAMTPLQMVSGYAIFANGGFRVQPYIISHIEDGEGKVVFKAAPQRAGESAPRAISGANSYLMNDLLHNAAAYGTAAATNALQRSDISGKTGTTNQYRDGWFVGYQPQLAAVTWMGYDAPKSMGPGEWGSRNALPIWIDFMRHALADVPEQPLPAPPDISVVDGVAYDSQFMPGQGFVAQVEEHESASQAPSGQIRVLVSPDFPHERFSQASPGQTHELVSPDVRHEPSSQASSGQTRVLVSPDGRHEHPSQKAPGKTRALVSPVAPIDGAAGAVSSDERAKILRYFSN